jgi:hypothetical protein
MHREPGRWLRKVVFDEDDCRLNICRVYAVQRHCPALIALHGLEEALG